MSKEYLIWDLPLRVFHWCLVITILALWYTSEQEGEMIDLHMQLGYVALGLMLFRVIWGFLGTTHSRFTQFLPKPNDIASYLSANSTRSTKCYPGHNPLGSLMVVLMIVLILSQAISGLFINDDVFSSGPYYGELSNTATEWMSFIHHNAFDFILAAIALHIGAIFYYRVVKKKALVKAMVTGKKAEDDVTEDDSIAHSKLVIAGVVIAVVVAFVYWLVVVNVPAVEAIYF